MADIVVSGPRFPSPPVDSFERVFEAFPQSDGDLEHSDVPVVYLTHQLTGRWVRVTPGPMRSKASVTAEVWEAHGWVPFVTVATDLRDDAFTDMRAQALEVTDAMIRSSAKLAH